MSDYLQALSTRCQGTSVVWVLWLVLTVNSPVVVAENMLGVAMYELVSVPHLMGMQVTDDASA